MNNNLEKAEEILGYKFSNKALLEQALTHSSYANDLKKNPLYSNERLEFLGDAILEEIVSCCLYQALLDFDEGKLTKIRAAIVCEKSLAEAAKKRDIPSLILLGKGEEQTGGRHRDSIISDCVEALFGAVFLDGGREAAKKVIEKLLEENGKLAAEGKLFLDSKSELQELLQKKGITEISYEIVSESGPAHNKSFEAIVCVKGKEIGRGIGKSKQQAQSKAAEKALLKLLEK